MSLRYISISFLACLVVFSAACGSSSGDPELEFVALSPDGSLIQIDAVVPVDSTISDGVIADPGVVPDGTTIDVGKDSVGGDIVKPPIDEGPPTECELAGVPDTGLCDGDNLIGCVNGEVFVVNCAELGLFCGTQQDGDLSCVDSPCEPICGGKECGDNGCGGVCGLCGGGEFCNKNGQCVLECTPQCEGKDCGPDGCGSVCGECGDSKICTDGGLCVLECEPSCVGKQCGPDGCGGTCGACDAGFSCGSVGQCNEDCVSQCEGKQCGPDTCGGSCGSCDDNQFCNDQGQCKSLCQPSCEGKECGPDGCGGHCGLCLDDAQCNLNGLCQPNCLPQCQGKECGPDGCGGSCGTCDEDLVCGNNGACKPPPTPCDLCGPDEICQDEVCVKDPACGPHSWVGCCGEGSTTYCQNGQVITKNCGDGGCGWMANQQYYYCGGQGSDPTGQFSIECPCEPQCGGKQCGGDGCGGTCGTCTPGKACDPAGQCVTIPPVNPCDGIPVIGQCDDDVKITCEGGVVQEVDCAAQDMVCWIQIFPVIQVACKSPWLANCPEFLFDGYCSGNLLIQCEGDDLWIEDCEEDGKVCGFTGPFGVECIGD